MRDRDAVVVAWCALDRTAALLAADRELADAAAPLRGMVVDFARDGGSDEEIYDACAHLGRMIGQRGGSPTFAALTMDHAAAAMDLGPAAWLAGARAAVAEGFTAAVLEKAREEALSTWDFPRCAVPLPDHGIAIAGGHPSEDSEVLAEWAARVAKAAALGGARRAHVAGSPAAREALREALEIVGIDAAED